MEEYGAASTSRMDSQGCKYIRLAVVTHIFTRVHTNFYAIATHLEPLFLSKVSTFFPKVTVH